MQTDMVMSSEGSDAGSTDSWEDQDSHKEMQNGAAHALVKLLIKRRESLSEAPLLPSTAGSATVMAPAPSSPKLVKEQAVSSTATTPGSASGTPRKRRPQICQRCGQLRKGHKCPLAGDKKFGRSEGEPRQRAAKRKIYVLDEENVNKENQPATVDPIAAFVSRVSTTFHIPVPALDNLFYEFVERYEPERHALSAETVARCQEQGFSPPKPGPRPAGNYVMSVMQHMVTQGKLSVAREQDCARAAPDKVLLSGEGAEVWISGQ